MADIRAKTTLGQWRAVRADPEGRVITQEPPISIEFGPTTGAVSKTTDLDTLLQKRPGELLMAEIKFSAAPTTSESFTLTLQSHRGAAQFDVVIFSNNPSLTSSTSVVNIWDNPYPLEPGDELVAAYTNTDANTVAGRIVVRPVS